VARRDYYRDPGAPAANSLVPGASAIVVDEAGRIALHRRTDNDLWALPSGTMEIGESIGQTAVREVREEIGLVVEPVRLVGVYSDPEHVFAYDDGEVRQEFNVCIACRVVGGELAAGDEAREVGWFTPEEIDDLPMHESVRKRIRDCGAGRSGIIA
jgi:ADP-ribose pyrophosphatase YjhB (NUDIX family)